MKIGVILLFSLSVFCNQSFAECTDGCPPPAPQQSQNWTNGLRIKALKKLDRFLSWSTSQNLKSFALADPLQQERFEVDISEISQFAKEYGYFSLERPLIGKVTRSDDDIKRVSCVLEALFEKGDDLEYLDFATAEVLSKALAYRDLKKGQKIAIPIVLQDKAQFELYTVDQIFNLWRGMPAFGLTPKHAEAPPILLFRGTDFSLDSQRGWASLMSDLDSAGPGLSAFHRARNQIHEWLISSSGRGAKVMGFSLGGALAAYTFIYENPSIASHGSIAFCPPGVAQKVIEDWKQLPEARRKGFMIYVDTGDIISKVGKLFGVVYALSTYKALRPLSAHTALMSAQPIFYKTLIDTTQENLERK